MYKSKPLSPHSDSDGQEIGIYLVYLYWSTSAYSGNAKYLLLNSKEVAFLAKVERKLQLPVSPLGLTKKCHAYSRSCGTRLPTSN